MTRQGTATAELTLAFTVQQSALAKSEENRIFKRLRQILTEIRKNRRLMGYTLRNSSQAIADLNKAEELIELSLLSAQIFDSVQQLLGVCNREQMKNAVLEGSRMRILCVSIKGNQVSIFTEKSVDYQPILEKLSEVDN